jgi:hypothetical protein
MQLCQLQYLVWRCLFKTSPSCSVLSRKDCLIRSWCCRSWGRRFAPNRCRLFATNLSISTRCCFSIAIACLVKINSLNKTFSFKLSFSWRLRKAAHIDLCHDCKYKVIRCYSRFNQIYKNSISTNLRCVRDYFGNMFYFLYLVWGIKENSIAKECSYHFSGDLAKIYLITIKIAKIMYKVQNIFFLW